MNKKSSTRKYILMSFIALIGIILTVCSFNIPFTNYKYNGFANAIKLGLDLEGGVEAVYEASLPENSNANLDESIDATIKRLNDLLTEKGYTESTVSKQNINRIRIEVPDVDDPSEIFEMIGTPATLEFKKEKSDDAEAILTGDNIKNVEAAYQNSEWGVSIQFDIEGGKKFKNLTEEQQGKSIYIYIGGELYSEPTVNEAITGGSTFISGSMNSKEEAEAFALAIKSGTFSTELELLSNNVVSATLGKDAMKLGLIAGLVGLFLIFLFMFIVYREFGLLANFSIVFYLVILMFLLATVPFVQLTLPGIAGIILSLGMAVDANVIIFERIKDEYRNGKKIPACVKAGFSKATVSILDSNITTIIASFVLYILGTGAIKGFAITLLLGIIVSMFSSLVISKFLIRNYLPFNSTKPKRLNLKREEGVNELG